MARFDIQMIDNGKVYYRVATGLSKAEALNLAARYRRNGNSARLRKYKFGKYHVAYKWDLYLHGRLGGLLALRG